MSGVLDTLIVPTEFAAGRAATAGHPYTGRRPASLLDLLEQNQDTETLSRLLAHRLGIPVVSELADGAASPEFVEKIPISYARQQLVIGLAGDEPRMPLAVANLLDPEPRQIVSRMLGRQVTPVLAPGGAILAAINSAYQRRTGQAATLLGKLDRKDVLAELNDLPSREDLLDVASRAPVIKLVNLILFEAVQARASDVHVQPYEQRTVVRTRIDGVLYDSFDIPKPLQEEVISRIKIMGRMNIAEKRLPQDGRATVQVGDRGIDLRIATLPTTFGERAVIRLLDRGERLYTASELGMADETFARFRRLIASEHGIVLVTGPTGSGKTTTLYAALREIDASRRNILTLEDPVEYRLPGISQTQISEKKGMTFASGLRSVLRQDPDIIMVGEIRDKETAVMAIQSALTGHLVFSTLHTNDAASAITRLLELGIEPYLLASSVIGVLAQRLVRRVCPQCRGTATDRPRRRGAGCEACRNTGYRGRIGVFELLAVDERVRQLVQGRATAADIKSAAIAAQMRTLRDDGLDKVARGITTMDEVMRVTMQDET